jgi:anaerobic selenocysteine-containing dehydrogenase
MARKNDRDRVDASRPVSDTVKTTTCYMCACRCGIRVHLKDGRIRYIEGNPDHPVNKGVMCGKGAAGIMQQQSPARLTKPLKRVGERGSGDFVEIEWSEALETATKWLADIRRDDPRKLAFFTGRDQSQALTGWWASQFGTPNYAAHGGFCSVNMAAAGMYSIGGSFWEFGEPDWEHTEYLLMFGVAEDHASNPIKIGLGKMKARGAKVVSINPVQTGYSAIADEWLPVTPGTDGLLVLSLVHELLRAGKVDLDYLVRYTNAAWLVIQNPGVEDDGLFARDENGTPLVFDRAQGQACPHDEAGAKPALKGEYVLADGRRAVPVFHLLATRYSDEAYAPANVAARTGISAETIERIAAELAHYAFERTITLDIPWTDAAGRRHEKTVGRPVSMHAMRGIAAHANGFQTCRALHVLQMLLGSIDVPGGFRYCPPYPQSTPPPARPAGPPAEPGMTLHGPPLGYPASPRDLLVDEAGNAQRIDKAFSWEAPLAVHGMLQTVITNAYEGDPYKIDTLFMYMANMAWNSAMNTTETAEMLCAKDESGDYRIPRIIYSDAYYSETVAYADLVLPDTTYLERWDCISLLDRPISDADGAADSIRQPIMKPRRDVRPFQDVLLNLGARLGLPGISNADGGPTYPGGYADYLINHERKPGVGPLAGWRGRNGDQEGIGSPNQEQLERYIENGCYWRAELAPEQRYYRFANDAYLDWSKELGFIVDKEPVVLQLYSEVMQSFRLAAEGHGDVLPPEHYRERVKTYFDPLPFWYAPFEEHERQGESYPLHALTQRPMAMYHSWGSQNAWLRQIYGENVLYVPKAVADAANLVDGDWAWVISRRGRIKVQVRPMEGLNANTVWTWNAIGKRAGAWNLATDAPEAERGFLLNHLTDDRLAEQGGRQRMANVDPITGQAAWFDLCVRLEKAEAGARRSEPIFSTLGHPPGLVPPPDELRYGERFRPARGAKP